MRPPRWSAMGLGRRFMGATPASNTAGNRDLGSIPNPRWPVNTQHGHSGGLGAKKSQTTSRHGKSGKLGVRQGLISRNGSKPKGHAGKQTREPAVVLELLGILAVSEPVCQLSVADLDT